MPDTDPRIAHMLRHAALGPDEYRPAYMEAVIRGGSDHQAVLEAFAATPDEQRRVDQLLAMPRPGRTE